MGYGALEDGMYDTSRLAERGIQWLPLHQSCRENCAGEVACTVEVSVKERAVSHNGLLPCHTDHRDAIAIIVVVRHRSDDDKARPGKTLSRSDDVVKGARLGPCQDPQLGEIWHHDIGVLNRILHQGHGFVWDVGSELAVWSHVCHDGVTDPYLSLIHI